MPGAGSEQQALSAIGCCFQHQTTAWQLSKALLPAAAVCVSQVLPKLLQQGLLDTLRLITLQQGSKPVWGMNTSNGWSSVAAPLVSTVGGVETRCACLTLMHTLLLAASACPLNHGDSQGQDHAPAPYSQQHESPQPSLPIAFVHAIKAAAQHTLVSAAKLLSPAPSGRVMGPSLGSSGGAGSAGAWSMLALPCLKLTVVLTAQVRGLARRIGL